MPPYDITLIGNGFEGEDTAIGILYHTISVVANSGGDLPLEPVPSIYIGSSIGYGRGICGDTGAANSGYIFIDAERLHNISKTNKILANIRIILKDFQKEKRIIGKEREYILELLRAEKGFIDWITLSSSLLFSAKYITDFEGLTKEAFYNNIKQQDYNTDSYLEDVERVQMDYKDLFELYKNEENVVFLIDPPYLSTDTKTYKNMDYWRLGDYLDILNLLEGKYYFYFTSEKSQIIELATWLSKNGFKKNPFAEATTKVIRTSLNHTAKYNDIMIYKK